MIPIYFGRFCRLFCNFFFQGVLFGTFLLFVRASFTASNSCVAMINIYRFTQSISGTSRSTCLRPLRIQNNFFSTNGHALRIRRYSSTSQTEGVFDLTNASASYLRGSRDDNVGRYVTRFTLIRRVGSIARSIGSRNSRVHANFSLRIFDYVFNVILRRSGQVLWSFRHRLVYRNAVFTCAIQIITL